MGWKPELKTGNSWGRNGLTFATREEAEASARDTFMRWLGADDHRAVEVEWAHPSHRYVDGKVVPISTAEPTIPTIVSDTTREDS